MDHQATPFPGKVQSMKSKTQRKSSETPMLKAKEPPLVHREKRVFGTVRNTNIQAAKIASEKPKSKPSTGIVKKLTKSANDASSSETPERKLAKKRVNFQENTEEIKEKGSKEADISVPRTPVRSPLLVKPRALATPYLSAERCSKCRFDKLETSSYWLAQIKLAESVGKHFVSANFFRMASECRAEPLRNMKVELKKYVARNEHDLGDEKEWKDLSVSYGLIKDES